MLCYFLKKITKKKKDVTWDLLTEADIEKWLSVLADVWRSGCDRDVGVRLDFLDGSIKAEISDRKAVALCQV